jgi:PTH1 family peptidyl-tRNA hydrolase
MRLLVGLGNPGERYRRTRHNAGFMVVDELAARAEALRPCPVPDAWAAEARLHGADVLLVKPLAFMNRSGAALLPLVERFGLAPADVLAVVDDVALELGTLRLRERGSHGGHNGLRSLIEAFGSEDFPRLRVGIRSGEPPADLAGYVLADFGPDEVLVVQEMVGQAAEAAICCLRDGTATAMSRYNGPRRPVA